MTMSQEPRRTNSEKTFVVLHSQLRTHDGGFWGEATTPTIQIIGHVVS